MSETLTTFLEQLEDLGYFKVYAHSGEGGTRIDSWLESAEDIGGKLGIALNAFLLGKVVSYDALAETVGEAAIAELHASGIVELKPGKSGVITRYRLIRCCGIYLFFDLQCNSQAYFGDDSLALLRYRDGSRKKSALDLCAGSGCQALHVAQMARSVDAVEINPAAAAILALNIKMNRLDDKISIYQNDASRFLRDSRKTYDYITFNPPLLPIPEGLAYPLVGAGGSDGLLVTREILKEVFPRMTEDCVIEFIGTICSGPKKSIESQLQNLTDNRLDCSVIITSHHKMKRGYDVYDLYAKTLADFNYIPISQIDKIVDSFLEKNNFQNLSYFIARVKKGTGRVRIDSIGITQIGGWFP